MLQKKGVVVVVDIYCRCAVINIVHSIDNLVIAQLTTQPQKAYYTPWLGTDCWSDYEKNNNTQSTIFFPFFLGFTGDLNDNFKHFPTVRSVIEKPLDSYFDFYFG